ncbi:TrmH family RNA methyltransferase [Mycoplasmopsis mustelae]|uniref:TrmH family RNA methyltransferase n=1 Tax=Mycoplasmopsis mustelae TaxID=171289 RepID=A0A4R7UFB3_9BACT|nr:RNA methyltransferase [Mycoplasmopsis mustelae]TDV24305.1 TrmH family RNA methyltransferase [Mycoplasmopsis mustelae]
MTSITSKQNPLIKYLKKLENKKYRDQEQKFVIFGEHLIEIALQKGIVIQLFESENSNLYPQATKLSHYLFEYLSNTSSASKVVALCDKTKLITNKANKIIALNNLQDPGNVGTIIRLAKAFDFDSVLIENLDPYSEKVIRSSQGAIFEVNILQTKDLYRDLMRLKKDFYLYQTILNQHAKALNAVKFQQKNIIIILGNEGQGITTKIQELADESIYIPISFESLNVASAAAIVLNKIRNG